MITGLPRGEINFLSVVLQNKRARCTAAQDAQQIMRFKRIRKLLSPPLKSRNTLQKIIKDRIN